MPAMTPYVRQLVAIATQEFDRLSEFDESDEPLRSRIDTYCDAIGIARPGNIEDFAWSATFVSWCIKTAGATAAEFKFSARHAVFVRAAIADADAERGVFRARPIETGKPKPGDIIHRNRNGGRITYRQARNRSNYESHSAIVVELGESGGAKFAVTVGGNEGNSIRRQRVPLTPDGRIRQTDGNPYIAVVENLKVEAGAHEVLPEFVDEPAMTTVAGEESVVCDACGEPRQPVLEAASLVPENAPGKPPARQEPTANKNSRGGTRIDHIVIHYTTSRSIAGTISHFKKPASGVSAHYIVGQDGALVQMVPDAERAWHAGNSLMNARSIGIEHVAALGDKITPAQSETSIALIRHLMHVHGVPLSNVIPHVCVKPTSCCGDLFKDFGGGAGFSCAKQTAAIRGWLAANGIDRGVEAVFSGEATAADTPVWITPEAASHSQRAAMAKAIVDFEARRDSAGRIKVHELHPSDGGGRYEVAGINERYHKAECDELVALIGAGRHEEAERRAGEFIMRYTDKAATWTQNAGIEFYLRDCMFNRGPGGAAWILQKAVGVPIDRKVGRETLAAVQAAEARPRELIDRLRAARESYERLKRDESSIFWIGLVNRWNKARQKALALMAETEAALESGAAAEFAAPVERLPDGFEERAQSDIGENVPFIDDAPPERPSFHDIGGNSPIDDPARMLAGIRAFRNNVDPELVFEAAVGRDTSLPSAFLEVMAAQRRAVGKISASGIDYLGRNGSWSGTGFLVARNILLTNHHVLNSADVASRAVVDFGFEVGPAELVAGAVEPRGPSARRYRLDPAKLFVTSPVSNKGLDYTFVWIEDDAASAFGSIAMTRAAFSVAEGERAFIVHHPNGRGRRVSLDENDVLRITTAVVRYSTDTEPGSSGSPVFDRQGRLIALHHASTRDPAMMPSGMATDVLNEGVKIAAIVADVEARANGPDGAMTHRVLGAVRGSDTMSGFFGSLGRRESVVPGAIGAERVVDVYKGSEDDVDIGFWNIEWLANGYRDRDKLRLAAFLIVDLGLDIWGLAEVSPPAVEALVRELEAGFGERYGFALSEPHAPESKQSTAVIWKTKTVTGAREEWPSDVERLWHLRSTDDLGLEAVEGKIFDRYPGLFRFSMTRGGAPFEFYVVPLHLKAFAEGSKRRRLASRLLAHAVKTMTEKHDKSRDWVLGGDYNAELATDDFKALLQDGFVPLSAADEDAGAFSYIKSPRSLIDHIFLSPNLAQQAGEDSFFIVAKDKSVDNYARKLSDHRPVLVRLSLSRGGAERRAEPQDIDGEIARLLEGSLESRFRGPARGRARVPALSA